MKEITFPIIRAYRVLNFPLILLDSKQALFYFDTDLNFSHKDYIDGRSVAEVFGHLEKFKDCLSLTIQAKKIHIPIVDSFLNKSKDLIILDSSYKYHCFSLDGSYKGFLDSGTNALLNMNNFKLN